MRFIGDVHGKFNRYLRLLDSPSIQVGDFGAGFVELPVMDCCHRVIRGNHDCLDVLRGYPNWIEDGHYENAMFFVGGALSIDRQLRVEGVSWWSDEELSINDLVRICDIYTAKRPRVMVTHDCPESIASRLFCDSMKLEYPSRTRQCFDSMLSLHQPETWIFGHWHRSRDCMVDGVRYICLAELEYVDL